jgi:hypothetical protein
MSKKARQQSKSNKSQPKSRHKWKTSVIAGLVLCFGLSGLVIAQWRATRLAGTANAMLASAAPLPTPDLSASNPSKEYIYAGGRLIATEEPQAATTPTPTPTPDPRINVALDTNGGVASAYTSLTGYAPSTANNGDRLGLNWGTSGGWADNTPNTFPDWLQVTFNGPKSINEVSVFTVQDNYSNPGIPNETMTFSSYGITSFDVQYWDGSAWVNVPNVSVNNNYFVWKKVTFAPLTTEMIRISVNNSVGGYSCITEVEAYGVPATVLTNYALSTQGGRARASSEYGGGYSAGNAINGERVGSNWGTTGGWNDAVPANTFPDWLEVEFNGPKSIQEISVFSVQDNYTSPSVPDLNTPFTLYGLTAFKVQSWNGTTWVDIPGMSVSENYKVWKKFTVTPITTSKIRVLTSASPDGNSRIAELEAWGWDAPPTGTNVALSSNGAIASASSIYSTDYPASGAINGDRLNAGAGNYWNDAGPANTFPDSLVVDFQAQKTIHEIDVFTMQDSYWAPLEPTTGMTFTYYGLTDFKVQSWNGTSWVDIPGAGATGNNFVWKRFQFPDITTNKIRVWCTGSADGWSRVVEVQAWGN